MDRSRSHLYSQAGSLLAGAGVVALIGNALHPRGDMSETVAVSNAAAEIATVNDSTIWLASHLIIAAGALGLLVGLVALASDLYREDRARTWAAAAGVLAVIFGGFTTTMIMIDGISVSLFAASGDAAGAAAIVAIQFGTFAALQMLVFGILPMVYGMAIVRSDSYPHWTGFVALAAGVLGIVSGATLAVSGEITGFVIGLFLLASAAQTLNLIYLGTVMRRHALAIAPGAAATPA